MSGACERCIAQGMDSCLAKPLRSADITAELANVAKPLEVRPCRAFYFERRL